MPSEPDSIPELARMFRSLEATFERRFTALETMLRGYVSAELHSMYERRMDERMADLQKDLEDEINARQNAITDMRKTQRWVASAVIIPSVALIATVVAIVVGRL